MKKLTYKRVSIEGRIPRKGRNIHWLTQKNFWKLIAIRDSL